LDTAQSAKEGLKTLQSKTFDAIIVDYAMPEISGIDFLKTLRSKGDRTPVIIFTAVGRDNVAIEALNYGANFFLHKREDPRMQFRELVTVVTQAVEQNPVGRSLNATQRIISEMVNFPRIPASPLTRMVR
jgi:DNA-binding response OmpR family regulator